MHWWSRAAITWMELGSINISISHSTIEYEVPSRDLVGYWCDKWVLSDVYVLWYIPESKEISPCILSRTAHQKTLTFCYVHYINYMQQTGCSEHVMKEGVVFIPCVCVWCVASALASNSLASRSFYGAHDAETAPRRSERRETHGNAAYQCNHTMYYHYILRIYQYLLFVQVDVTNKVHLNSFGKPFWNLEVELLLLKGM